MKAAYLEVTFRRGRALAAYLYLSRKSTDRAERTGKVAGGMLVDYSADGRPIGVEFTDISHVSLEAVNRILAQANETPATEADLAPLKVA